MKKSVILFILLMAMPTLFAQWSTDASTAEALTVSDCDIFDSEVRINDDGITYVLYNTPQDGSIATYLQIIDSEGNYLTGDSDKLISNKPTRTYNVVNQMSMIDNDGNIVLAVTSCGNTPEGAEALNYTIYKVSPTGEMLWGEDGIDINKGGYHDLLAFMTMTQLEDGSYIFAWQECYGSSNGLSLYTSGIFSYTSTTLSYDGVTRYVIKAERVSSEGEFLWDETLLIEDESSSCAYPHIVSAGNNQAILVYAQGSNQNIYARKIDFDASSVWATETVVYKGGFSSTTPLYLMLSVQPDPNGGVFIGWYDDRYYTNVESAYISYVGADGTLKFEESTAGLATEYNDVLRTLSYYFCYNETEECIYALWRGVYSASQSYQGIFMQKITLQGEIMWGSEGVAIKEVDLHTYKSLSIENAEDGGVVAFFMESVESYGHTESYAAKLTTDGSFAWADSVYSLTPSVTEKSYLESSQLVDDYWITTWREQKEDANDNHDRIYGCKLLTTPSTMGDVALVPDNATFAVKTTDGAVTFATNSNEAATITIYTVAGATTTTNGTASYSTTGLAAGVYIARLTSGSTASTTRFVVK